MWTFWLAILIKNKPLVPRGLVINVCLCLIWTLLFCPFSLVTGNSCSGSMRMFGQWLKSLHTIRVENICGHRKHQKPKGRLLTRKNQTGNSHAMEQSQFWSKFVTELVTTPSHGNYQSDSFGPIYDPSGFDVSYVHKYSHDFSEFPWYLNSIFMKNIGHDHGNTITVAAHI